MTQITERIDGLPGGKTEPSGVGEKGKEELALEGRGNNFDALRFTLAVLVIWSHCFPFLDGSAAKTEPLWRWTGGRATFGEIAVDGFFIISGYLITMSWEHSSGVWSYLKKRVGRIYPGYIVVTLLCALIVAPLFGGEKLNVFTLAKALPRLQEYRVDGVFGGNPYPGSMYGAVWTVKYEFGCYLMVLGLGVVGLLKRRWVVLVLFVAATVVYGAGVRVWLPKGVENVVGEAENWPHFLSFYTAGMVFYVYHSQIPIRNWLAGVSAVVLAGSFWCLPVFPLALALCGPYLIFWLAFQKHVSVAHFARYGDFSYGIYLYAFPIQQILVTVIGAQKLTPVGLFLLATPLAILAGAISWHGVEKWFLRKRVKSMVGK